MTARFPGARLVLAAAMAALPWSAPAGEGVFASRIYRPDPISSEAPEWISSAPVEVEVRTADGLRLRGMYWAPTRPDAELLVFFHGNGGNRITAAKMAEPLARDGRGVLVASYRGYGDHPGTPSEGGLFADGRAFLASARELSPQSPIVLFGYSLGAAVALELAATEQVRGVVTLGAFSSLADVAPRLVSRMLKGAYDNRAAIARVDEPVLILHGTADEIVPFAQAQRLKEAAPRARLLQLNGAPHRFDLTELASTVWSNVAQMPE